MFDTTRPAGLISLQFMSHERSVAEGDGSGRFCEASGFLPEF